MGVARLRRRTVVGALASLALAVACGGETEGAPIEADGGSSPARWMEPRAAALASPARWWSRLGGVDVPGCGNVTQFCANGIWHGDCPG